MKIRKHFSVLLILLVGIIFMRPVLATNNLPTSGTLPDVVYLRVDCGALNDCATTFKEVIDWTWATRKPDALAPLLIDAGPGTFDTLSRLVCDAGAGDGGHLTIRGSGRDNTVFTASNGNNFSAVFTVIGCNKMNFQDFTIKGNVGNAEWGIEWGSIGSSSWTNVISDAPKFAWYDSAGGGGCTAGSGGRHDFYSSTMRISGITAVNPFNVGIIAFYSACGDSWLWGSEVVNNSEKAGKRFGVKAISPGAQVRMFGSNVLVKSDTADVNALTGLRSQGGGAVHIHGGIVAVKALGTGNQSVIGGDADGTGSLVHAHETAWNLTSSGSGTTTRLNNTASGTAEAGFAWKPGTEPPSITTIDGADSFVETDCASIGCQSTGTETHLHIYNSACVTAGPWFDVVTGKCRGL